MIDTKTDRSDVKSLLDNIRMMFYASQNTMNDYSRASLLLALSIEAEMLCLKLNTMYKRWQIHLPFKKASGIDFFDWARKAENMSRQVAQPDQKLSSQTEAYCPSKHFLLDLCCMLPEGGDQETPKLPYYKHKSVSTLLRLQKQMRQRMASQWPVYRHSLSALTVQRVSLRMHADLNHLLCEEDIIREVCQNVLLDLAEVLRRLSDMSLHVISDEECFRLAERIVSEPEYGGRNAIRDALAYFTKWKNSIPASQAAEEREFEIEIAVNQIKLMKYGRFLVRYVHLEDDVNTQMKGFGRFLHIYRQQLGLGELRDILEQFYRIHFFLEDQRQSAVRPVVEREDSKITVPQDSTGHPQPGDTPPELPYFFSHSLRANEDATKLLLSILQKAGPYMCCNLTKNERNQPEAKPYVDWKWNHLIKVFEELELIKENTRLSDFADFLARLLPGRKTGNILQSMYRNSDNRNPDILADVKAAFRPVRKLLAQAPSTVTDDMDF